MESPGPWQLSWNSWNHAEILDGVGNTLFSMDFDEDMSEQDVGQMLHVKLTIASRDLLKACESLIEAYDNYEDNCMDAEDQYHHALGMMRIAIRKAKGGA